MDICLGPGTTFLNASKIDFIQLQGATKMKILHYYTKTKKKSFIPHATEQNSKKENNTSSTRLPN